MAFKEGNSLGGRTPGSKNKTTTEIRERFKLLIEDNLESIQADLNSLDPEDRLKILLSLSKYVLPTLRSTELTSELENKTITIDFTE